jgi:hypothetical protein
MQLRRKVDVFFGKMDVLMRYAGVCIWMYFILDLLKDDLVSTSDAFSAQCASFSLDRVDPSRCGCKVQGRVEIILSSTRFWIVIISILIDGLLVILRILDWGTLDQVCILLWMIIVCHGNILFTHRRGNRTCASHVPL